MRKITIVVKDGKLQVRTEGFRGRECLDEMRRLSEALGGDLSPEEIRPTSEYYAAPQRAKEVEAR